MDDKVTRKNARKARTKFQDVTGDWYILDNAAVIMPAVSDSVSTSLFRVSADLDAPVHLPSLQLALDRTARRFPYFCVELRRGFFWYFLEPYGKRILVEADAASPCQGFQVRKKGQCLYRVRARGKRISCEFSHTLTDGTGGMRFLKNLLVEYCRLRGTEAGGADPDVYDLEAAPLPEETEDAYNRHFPGSYPHPQKLEKAFHLPKDNLPRHDYRILTGTIPLGPLLAKAKEYGVSLTEFLAATYLDALQEVFFSLDPAARSKARPYAGLEIPVNMRRFYPTGTNHNFTLFIIVGEDFRLGRRSFEELVQRTHHRMRIEVDAKSIARQISRNVGGSRMLAVRLVPLCIKDFFARLLFASLGESLVSGFLSNLGTVSLPPGTASRVERLDFYPAPSRVTRTNASLVTWKDKVYLSFGSLTRSRELERFFFTHLRSLGIPVRVECNLEDF
jgi:hypothetical protein